MIWRYLPCMKHFLFFLLALLVASGAWAQPAPARDVGYVQPAPVQRRAELRLALTPIRAREAQSKDQSLGAAPLGRQLSAQERADLRQQLRQQRRDVKLERP